MLLYIPLILTIILFPRFHTSIHRSGLLIIFTATPLAISLFLFTALAAVLHFAKQPTSPHTHALLHPSLHTNSQSEQDYDHTIGTTMKRTNNNQQITLDHKQYQQQYRGHSVVVGISSVSSGDTTQELLPSVLLSHHDNHPLPTALVASSSLPQLQKSSSAIPFTYR